MAKRILPRNTRELQALSQYRKDVRERALAAVARSRRDSISLTKASKLEGTTLRTVGRYVSSPRSKFDRTLRGPFPITENGYTVNVYVTDSRVASKLSRYPRARDANLEDRRNVSLLKEFRRWSFVDADGVRHSPDTDGNVIRDWLDRGEDRYQEFYSA